MIAAFALRARTAGTFQVIDEFQWMRRSEGFSNALASFDPSAASVTSTPSPIGGDLKTMPGVTTMWVGTVGRGIWSLAKATGLIHDERAFTQSALALHVAQTVMAAVTSLLVGLTVWLVARWVGWRAAVLSGVALAAEPFLVAHGAVLHTDELQALFATAGTIALALALGLPRPRGARVVPTGILAGVLLAGAGLTKLSGLTVVPGAAVLVAWSLVGAASSRPAASPRGTWDSVRPTIRTCGVVVLAALTTVLLAYPAMWSGTSTEIEAMRRASTIGYGASTSFFMGEVITDGSPWFYAVALPYRMTPWLLIAMVIGVASALLHRSTRREVAVLVVVSVPIAWTLSTIPKQFDRYGLTLIAFAIIAASIGLTARRLPTRIARPALGAYAVLAVATSWIIAPWGLAWFNPLLGGGQAAQRRVPIEWQEGQSAASALLAELVGERCSEVRYLGVNLFVLETDQCGVYALAGEPTHVIVNAPETQLMSDEELARLTDGLTLIGTLRIHDVVYARIWQRGDW